jgi:hypothetical protein
MASLEQLEAAADPARDWPLLPADSALTHLAALRLAPEALGAMVHGQPVYGLASGAALWRLYDAAERFLGLGESDTAGTLRVRRLFSSAQLAAAPASQEQSR